MENFREWLWLVEDIGFVVGAIAGGFYWFSSQFDK